MGLDNRTRFYVPFDWHIRNRRFYIERIWRPAMAESLSRRDWLEALEQLHRLKGRLFWPDDQTPFQVPRIKKEFDTDNRWWSTFDKADASGTRPKSFCRAYRKLRLIAVYCDIRAQEPDLFLPIR
jgi:hypothetical protein